MIIGLIGFMVVMSIILAFWEIQIEGKDGWAAKLPAWRKENGFWVKLSGGRPITGYHICMTVFLIGLVHLPLFFAPWTWQTECLILGFYVGMVSLEDFFWFVFNPAYGLNNFREGRIWWHKQWLGPVPSMYWILFPLAAILLWLGSEAI